MTSRLDARQVAAAGLTLKPIGEREYRVEIGGLTVGQIIAMRRSFGRKVWFWSLSGPHLPEAMTPAGSNAMTLEGAKAAITSALETWLLHAAGQRGKITWSRSTSSE